MAIYRCKMCGGDLEIIEGASSCTCEFCGTQQTIPTVKDEGLQTLFNRANVLRMKSEFDKAADIYEKILQKSDSEAEAYWGLILCKYGIEYVEDPTTYKRIPTCHRASYDAVTADEDYKNAVQYADAVQRSIYEKEAAAIDEIQKGIIALAQNADPYDVFVCYKETDESGKRTQDSVIANDIYHQLTQEGFKVFYAAITLEDKLGAEYEPYIFSALNTAKVMLALGTKPEYFNAVWVKNEWSRFLKIMKKDRSKLLIPCYRDMDAYELPEEFAHLQAQDMSKIGFISDLVRGIKKVVVKEAPQPKVVVAAVQQTAQMSGTTAAAQIERGNMALEDHDWKKADEFFEEALNLDPRSAEAYVGKLLAQAGKPSFASWISVQKEKYVKATTDRLEACPADAAHIAAKVNEFAIPGYLDADKIKEQYAFDRKYDSALAGRKSQKDKQLAELAGNRWLNRAQQYAAGDTKTRLANGLAEISTVLDKRISEAEAQDKQSIIRVKEAYAAHISAADKKAAELNADAQNRHEEQYRSAVKSMEAASDIPAYEKTMDALKAMNGYKDSDALTAKCQKEIDRLEEIGKKEKEQEAKKKKTVGAIAAAVAVLCIAAIIVVTQVIIPNNNYNAAVALLEAGSYEDAIGAFEALNGYKDSDAQIKVCEVGIQENNYRNAIALKDSGDYEAAIAAFEALNYYKDSVAQIEECKTGIKEINYNAAVALMEAGSYEEAKAAFDALGSYKDSVDQIENCKAALSGIAYNEAVALLESGDIIHAAMAFGSLSGYEDSEERSLLLWDEYGVKDVISSGELHTVGLKSDGTVVAVGNNYQGQCDVSYWRNIVAIAAGVYHTVGVKSDGTVVAVGLNNYGQCDVGDWTDIVSVAAGEFHTVGLKSDGTVVSVGLNEYSVCDVSGWTDIVAISASQDYTIGLRSDGSVVAVGHNYAGNFDISDWTDIVAISTGYYYTVGLKSDGTVVAVGNNYQGQCDVSEWKNIVAIATGGYHTLGLKADGTVLVVGGNEYGVSNVSNWKGIVAIFAGKYQTLGLKADGTMVATGKNKEGQCDVSDWSDIKIPTK